MPKTQDDEPPRTEEGMLIGWPELAELYPNIEYAVGVQLMHRAAGLDPDGPLKPMRPYKTDEQQIYEALEEGERHTRDWCLCNALRFT